ncbi:hypothetical protein SDC9_171889 [bioreactor metagenome]|uniref:Uncharacterized protein n=1 Tax=bioreactor metagenome TaxID=1076179 RepID=A0A645GEH2_9ZZZZ
MASLSALVALYVNAAFSGELTPKNKQRSLRILYIASDVFIAGSWPLRPGFPNGPRRNNSTAFVTSAETGYEVAALSKYMGFIISPLKA